MGTRFKALMNVLYPENVSCLCCSCQHLVKGENLLCTTCKTGLDKLRGPFFAPIPGFARTVYAYRYKEEARTLVMEMKYNSIVSAAQLLARAMADSVQAYAFDVIVPVPLYRVRERERGYNQAGELCKALSPMLSVPVACAIVRTRATHRQAKITDKAKRQANVAGAFAPVMSLDGMRVLLVDDVRTTGATATSCLAVLLEAGAEEVTLLTAAGTSWKATK